MTKTHEIIPITDGYVVIDKEAQPIINEFTLANGSIYRVLDKHIDNYRTNLGWFTNCVKVIASIGIKIEGVPLIELPQEDLITMAEEVYPEVTGDVHMAYEHNRGQNTRRIAWIRGYKANAKQYSEEDLRKAITMSRQTNTIVFDGKTKLHKYTDDEIIKSIQKVPISVKLEYEMIGNPHEWVDTLKVNPDNTITPIKITAL